MQWDTGASRLTDYWRTFSFGSAARRAVFHLARGLMQHAQLYVFAKQSIARVPFLDRRLRAIIRTGRQDAEDRAERIIDAADLTPRGHQVYLELLRVIKDLQ